MYKYIYIYIYTHTHTHTHTHKVTVNVKILYYSFLTNMLFPSTIIIINSIGLKIKIKTLMQMNLAIIVRLMLVINIIFGVFLIYNHRG